MPRPTRTISIDRDDPDPAALAEAAQVLRAGGLVAFATETVYGLGAVATDPAAVARIFDAKGRPSFNPLIVHASDLDMARACVDRWPPAAEALARAFWPGPLTLVLPRSAIIPDIVAANLSTVGVRIPAPAVARDLIRATGRPLAAPSANRSTALSPTLAAHVARSLGDAVEIILDSGPTAVGIESTVLDLSGPRPAIVRPGVLTAATISDLLGIEVADRPRATSAPSSPGQLSIHYAPRTPAVSIGPERLATFAWPPRFALLVLGDPGPIADPGAVAIRSLSTPAEAAAALYATLHDWDDLALDLIALVPPPDRPEWSAIRDRITRATKRIAAEDTEEEKKFY
ncbi:MAG TPA: L-threonylcarbamoyladenylate synthase [Isosphaeraceae bacterium]|nr:L-threonylcarbamoyladenylate synthase [Isosphaeraceae bacterium]